MLLRIKVIPNSHKTEIIEEKEGFLRINIRAKPQNNQANSELIRFLAKRFQISNNNIKIIKGKNIRNKLVKIS